MSICSIAHPGTVGNGKNCADSGWFDYQTECLTLIDPSLLMKSFGDKARLVAFYCSIGFMFEFEDPFTANHICCS
jgi:hypothetical protein